MYDLCPELGSRAKAKWFAPKESSGALYNNTVVQHDLPGQVIFISLSNDCKNSELNLCEFSVDWNDLAISHSRNVSCMDQTRALMISSCPDRGALVTVLDSASLREPCRYIKIGNEAYRVF